MSPRVVRLVFGKELRETLRDRRTLLVMVLLPLVLYPLMAIGVTQLVGVEEAKRRGEKSRVLVEGPAWLSLEQTLASSREIEIVRPTPARNSAREAVREGAVEAAIRVPEGYEGTLAADGTARLELLYNATRDRSTLARDRLSKLLGDLSASIRKDRLARRALPSTLPTPIDTREESVAQPKEAASHALAGMIPLLVILMVLLGAFYPAIDLTAGEKERGTLEALLAAPVESTDLLAGKFLVVATIATTTGVLNFGSMILTFTLGFRPALTAAGIETQVPLSALLLSLVALVPAALFFAALMVAVASLAGGFKEAQNFLTPIYLVCLLPASLAQVPWIAFTPLTALVPVLNLSLLSRALISERVPLLPTLLALLSTAGYTLLALRAAARAFSSERRLFPPDETRRRAPSRGGAPIRKALSAVEAGILLLLVMALLLLLGRPLQAWSLVGGLLLTEWALIALPVLLVAKVARLDPAPALGLLRARPLVLLGATLAGLSAWYLVGFLVDAVQQRVLPIPKEVSDELRRLLLGSGRSLVLDLFVFALSPAICEELLFRGALLGASQRILRPTSAVLVNGILFSLFHLDLYRLFPTFFLGVVLATLRLRSGSILPCVVFHFLNNGCAIVIGRLVGDTEPAAAKGHAGVLLLGLALAVFTLGMRLATFRPRDPNPDG